MPIVDDLSDIPEVPIQGDAPDANPRFGPILVERWHSEATDNPVAIPGSRFRHSDAGKCSRALAYAALRLPASNPVDAPSTFIMRQGDILHEALQDTLTHHFTDCEVEAVVGDDQRSGHIDVVVVVGGRRIAIEAKSVDGYAYKMAIGERGPAEGPKYEHKIQAALNAHAADADEAVILYLSRGAVAIGTAARKKLSPMLRVTAEWTLDKATFTEIALTEISRVTHILDLLDEGTLPARKIPSPELPPLHVITKPMSGTWAVFQGGLLQNAGSYWACAYCRWQRTCSKTDAGRTPVSVLNDIGAWDAEH